MTTETPVLSLFFSTVKSINTANNKKKHKATQREGNWNALERHFAVHDFDFLIRGVAWDAEDLVGVVPSELLLTTAVVDVVLLRLWVVPRHLAPPSNQTTSYTCFMLSIPKTLELGYREKSVRENGDRNGRDGEQVISSRACESRGRRNNEEGALGRRSRMKKLRWLSMKWVMMVGKMVISFMILICQSKCYYVILIIAIPWTYIF